jgi:hypothetical protein
MYHEHIHQFYNPASYSELSANNPDFIDLAERCELLSQIIVDANGTESITPVLRCLATYLHRLGLSLEEDMSCQRVLELTDTTTLPPSNKWIFADSDLQCEYCQTLTTLLIRHVCSPEERESLVGLLHDLISAMAFELKEPRFAVSSPSA